MKFKSLLLSAALCAFAVAALPVQAREAGDPVAPAVVGAHHGAKKKSEKTAKKPAKHLKVAAKHGKKPGKAMKAHQHGKSHGKPAKLAGHGKPVRHGRRVKSAKRKAS